METESDPKREDELLRDEKGVSVGAMSGLCGVEVGRLCASSPFLPFYPISSS